MRLRIAVCLAIALLAVACGDDGDNGDNGSTPSEITGVVTDVESTSLTEVESFTVKSDDKTYTILIDPNTDLGFPPAHLNEHRVTGDPVKVEMEERSGDLYALSILDA